MKIENEFIDGFDLHPGCSILGLPTPKQCQELIKGMVQSVRARSCELQGAELGEEPLCRCWGPWLRPISLTGSPGSWC